MANLRSHSQTDPNTKTVNRKVFCSGTIPVLEYDSNQQVKRGRHSDTEA